MTDFQYPIGTFVRKLSYSSQERAGLMQAIRVAPERLRQAVMGLNDAQLDTPYRDDGWTVRQVVHHVADSHINAFIRMKLALTEQTPTITPYAENEWAKLADCAMPADVSLRLLAALHDRWMVLLESVSDQAWTRNFMHPHNGITTLEQSLALYAWHSEHHTAHVTELRKRMNW